MIRKDMMSQKTMDVLSSPKEKKDFNVIIEAMSMVACLKKIDVKRMDSDAVLAFAKKYAEDINKEYKRIDTLKKYKQKKEERAKFW